MKRDRQKTVILTLALLILLALTACGPSASSPDSTPATAGNTSDAGQPTSDPSSEMAADSPAANEASPAQAGLPPADASSADGPVTLAYNPADSTLFIADNRGLFRWRPENGWQSVAVPQATGVSAVVIGGDPEQPATIYVSGLGLGVVRSDDDGRTWQAINEGLPNLDVTALALHSFRRETLYAWLEDSGTFRTEDGGANWIRVPDQGPPDKDVRGLAHSTLPGSMNTGWLYASTPTGAYLSMDCF